MKPSHVAATALFALAACSRDPARSVKIALEGLTRGDDGGAPAAPAGKWSPELCPRPDPPAAVRSNLVFSGPCAFVLRAALKCRSTDDDFHVLMFREISYLTTTVFHMNVEKYKGPGTYKGVEMFFSVQDPTSLFRWSSLDAEVTVEEGEKSVTMPPTSLRAEAGSPATGIVLISGTMGCADPGAE